MPTIPPSPPNTSIPPLLRQLTEQEAVVVEDMRYLPTANGYHLTADLSMLPRDLSQLLLDLNATLLVDVLTDGFSSGTGQSTGVIVGHHEGVTFLLHWQSPDYRDDECDASGSLTLKWADTIQDVEPVLLNFQAIAIECAVNTMSTVLSGFPPDLVPQVIASAITSLTDKLAQAPHDAPSEPPPPDGPQP